MEWFEVCPKGDLERAKAVVVGGRPIAVCVEEGECVAFADQCTDVLKNGGCLSPPATENLAIFPSRVEDSILRVQIGRP